MDPQEKHGDSVEYQVIARKWRPQGFKDIVGQEHITRTLQNSLRSGRIAHAFLFSGLRGVGKTTTARILAKALNCHRGITDEPCDECPSCIEIRRGNSVDVQEIDGASNRGIDSIRELRESVRYGTSRDRFKIFIIDEVHMLTKEAFNGLLKTLEEPPGHVKFIMATTEFYKIPPTIQSRCQKYEFKPISPEAILKQLKFVTAKEDIEISDRSLQSITALAQGSMRDAQSALDQVISFCGKKADDEDVKALLGVVDFQAVAEIFDAIISQDSRRMLEAYRGLVMKGVETEILCREMMEHVRNLMVVKICGWNERLLQLAETEKESLEDSASRVSEPDLVRFYDLLEQTAVELRRSSRPEIHLEMGLVKMVQLARLPMLESVLEKFMSGGGLSSGSSAPAAGPRLEKGAGHSREPKKSIPVRQPPTTPQPVSPVPEKEIELSGDKSGGGEAGGSDDSDKENEAVSGEGLIQSWLAKIKERSIGLYQSLNEADDIMYDPGPPDKLIIVFAHGDTFHAGQINRRQETALKMFKEVSGSRPKLEVKVRSEDNPEDKEEDPSDDPRVQSFLRRYPGRITVKKPN